MTAEHLRPVLESHRDAERFWNMCQAFARAEIPNEILQAIRMSRMSALQKPTYGAGSIVAIHFASSHFMLEAAIAFAWSVSVSCLCLLHSQKTLHLQMPVESRSCEDQGRVQSIGLEQVPRGRQCPAQCNHRNDPDAARDAARNKIFKMEKARSVKRFHRPGGRCPEVRVGRQAAKAPPLKVQISSTQDFIRRSERRLAELTAERTAESKLLEEAKARLCQLETARCAEEAVV